MARFLISTMPGAGTMAPAQPVAAALLRRGHQVWWHTGKAGEARVAGTGARFVPFDRTPTWDELPPVPDPGQTGFAAVNTMMRRLFVDRAPGQLADYEAILADFPADALITDASCLGADLLRGRGGPPWAVLHETALIGVCRDDPPHGSGGRPPTSALDRLRYRAINWINHHVALRHVTAAYQECRRGLGVPRMRRGRTVFDALISPYLYLQPATPALEFPRRLPPQVHLIGPLLPDPPDRFARPSWWPELEHADPVVHVTQGTSETNPTDLVLPAIRALAGHPGLVVVTVTDNATPAELPANVRFAPFIPHQELLPHVDVMVTNGGHNGVLAALARGVPLVAAGWKVDHPEVCARVERAGAGVWLRGPEATPEQIGAAVSEVLGNPSYRENARRIQREIAASDGAVVAVELLERLAATGAPVCRGDSTRIPAGREPAGPAWSA